MNKKVIISTVILGIIVIIFFVIGIVSGNNTTFTLQNTKEEKINNFEDIQKQESNSITISEEEVQMNELEKPQVLHKETPSEVRALYMTAWVASTPSIRNNLLNFISASNINSIVIDIKDATGRISFLVDDPVLNQIDSPRNLIRDAKSFIETLHKKDLYVIGRISVFQDDYLTKQKPEWAIQSKSTGKPWKDKKGLSFLDPTNKNVWDYTFRIAKASYETGFDEINFDYIRFPSDGIISDIQYPTSAGTKSEAMETFFKALHAEFSETSITTSADLFGMTTNNTDDLGIGQVLEKVLPYFDYISPMIYPSHYPAGFHGYSNPAANPYEIITIAMKKGIERAAVLGYGPEKFRPWIQDFNMGAMYTKDMVQAQIRALRELGITSYMSWDPKNKYTTGAY